MSVIRYYDSSAILPLYYNETFSKKAQAALARDFDQFVTSELTIVELRSALARLERSSKISKARATLIFEQIERDLQSTPRKLDVSGDVLRETLRLFASINLPVKALDAIHLASCLRYGTKGFVTGDKQQARLASTLGLSTQWLGGKLE